MFISVLLVTFLTAAAVAYGVVTLFNKPVAAIVRRVVSEEISSAWHRYIKFAAMVVGISGGVRIHQLERYISAQHKDLEVLVLTWERWTLEIYRTIIGTLQSIAWLYLVVFVVALVAYVIMRGFELRHGAASESQNNDT